MNLKNRQQLLLLLAGVAVALFLGDRFFFTPLAKTWKSRSDRIASLDKTVAQGELLIERASRLRDQWQNMRTNTLPLNLSAAENAVLKGFDRWSEQSRISISSIKPQWKRAADDFTLLECRADGFGSIESLSRFLHALEKDPLPLRVGSVEISARDNNGQQLALALQVSALRLTPEDE